MSCSKKCQGGKFWSPPPVQPCRPSLAQLGTQPLFCSQGSPPSTLWGVDNPPPWRSRSALGPCVTADCAMAAGGNGPVCLFVGRAVAPLPAGAHTTSTGLFFPFVLLFVRGTHQLETRQGSQDLTEFPIGRWKRVHWKVSSDSNRHSLKGFHTRNEMQKNERRCWKEVQKELKF